MSDFSIGLCKYYSSGKGVCAYIVDKECNGINIHVDKNNEDAAAACSQTAEKLRFLADAFDCLGRMGNPFEVGACSTAMKVAEGIEVVGQKEGSVVDKINEYLVNGGLFNPELTNHDVVRDILLDGRPTPVPMAERRPGPDDCNEDGMCWVRRKHDAQGDGSSKAVWRLETLAPVGGDSPIWYIEWLPYYAIPYLQ